MLAGVPVSQFLYRELGQHSHYSDYTTGRQPTVWLPEASGNFLFPKHPNHFYSPSSLLLSR